MFESLLRLECLINDMKAEISKLKRANGNNNYAKGYRLEYDLVRKLREDGFFAIRSPASKTVFDVIAIKHGEIYGFQCKYLSCKRSLNVSAKAKAVMLQLYEEHKIKPFICYRIRNKPLRLINLLNNKELSFKEFLAEVENAKLFNYC